MTIHDMKKKWEIFDLRDVKVIAGKYYNYVDDYSEQVSFLI